LLAPFLRYIWPSLQGDTIRINSLSSRRDAVKNSRPFEIALVLVRLDHVAKAFPRGGDLGSIELLPIHQSAVSLIAIGWTLI